MGAMTAMITKTGVKKQIVVYLKGKRCLWSVKFAHRVANVALGSKMETKTDRKAAQLLSNLIGIQNMNPLDGLDGSKMGNDKNNSVTIEPPHALIWGVGPASPRKQSE